LAISEETLTAIKCAYQIWVENNGDDVSALLDLMADDVDVRTLPDGTDPLTFTKACSNKAEMTEYFQALIGDWQMVRADIMEMVRERDVLVLLLGTTWRNRRTDKQFNSPAAHVWRFRDGLACEIRLFFDSAKWSEAAGIDFKVDDEFDGLGCACGGGCVLFWDGWACGKVTGWPGMHRRPWFGDPSVVSGQ